MAGTYSIFDYEGKRKEVSEAREREESATREKAREEESAAREKEESEAREKEELEAREREESAAREKAREEESAAREREAKNRNFSDKAPENSAHFPKVSLSVRGIIWDLAVLVTAKSQMIPLTLNETSKRLLPVNA